jgi:hypothetical protein
LKISRPRRKGFMDALTAYIGNVLWCFKIKCYFTS